jgi:hypothetical protein
VIKHTIVGATRQFACMRAACETLSGKGRGEIEKLVAKHDLAYSRSTIDSEMMSTAFRNEVPSESRQLSALCLSSRRDDLFG